MKLTFKQRLFLYISIAFALFALSVFLFEQTREKRIKSEAIEEKLGAYADIVNESIAKKTPDQYILILDNLSTLFPANLRLTIVNRNGKVLYDNSILGWSKLENHLGRPEIANSIKNRTGTDIRHSLSTGKEYLYFAKNEGDYFVRVALPNDVQVQRFFKSDNVFLYVTLLLFCILLILVNWIANSFGNSINELRNYAVNPKAKAELNFPKNEIGEIGKEIAENYKQLRATKNKIELEREKLLQHIHSSQEGICFFTVKKNAELYNGLFIQYTHIITDENYSDPKVIFVDRAFEELQQFLNDDKDNFKEYKIQKQGKTFSVRAIIFEDKSFEVVINDITKQENVKILKQQMISNIAHELRTPITGVSGYLETVLEKNLDAKTQQYFIAQAFNQTKVLTELVQDMNLINKIDEAGYTFKKSPLDISFLLKKIQEEYALQLRDNNITLHLKLPEQIIINANESLIKSIFKNLFDNAIRYAGKDISIFLTLLKEDKNYYYFSFADTGVGISDEKHLPRIFERFYRVDEGRTRETGGSGLGLSIVKNAITLHGGTISAKTRKDGGLEFIFQLHK